MNLAYFYNNPTKIKPLKEARTELLFALLQPWMSKEYISSKELKNDLQILDLGRNIKKVVSSYIEDYIFLQGKMIWKEEEIEILQSIIKNILGISNNEFEKCVIQMDPDLLRNMIRTRTYKMSNSEIEEICNLLTKVTGE